MTTKFVSVSHQPERGDFSIMKLFKACQFALILSFSLIVGCGSTLNIEKMVIDRTTFDTRHPATVTVKTIGETTNAQWGIATISPEEFREAVIKSLEKSALFKEIVYASQSTADYLLNLELVYINSHPGASMTAWVNVDWSLTKQSTGDKVWKAQIATEGHAGAFEAFIGTSRQRIALERGAQANIDQALTQIRELTLGSSAAQGKP